MLNVKIKSSVNKLWDKFWSGGISNPLTAIDQISYLLFMKRLDAIDIKKKQDAEFTGEPYESLFEGQLKIDAKTEPIDKATLRWGYFKHMEGGEMLTHVQTAVFPFLKTLDEEESHYAQHMKNAVFIISKPSLLVEAVNIIDEIFDEIAREESTGQSFQDTQGDLYEFLLAEMQSAGKLGQFRTPRHIIQLMCELVDPKLGDTICDPACGTGGFLLGAYQHIVTAHTSEQHAKIDENGLKRGQLGDKLTDERQWKHLKTKTFYGYDVDESMVRIGLMNLLLHGISSPNIAQKDTLSKRYDEDNHFEVILANPPFKGSIDKSDINESLALATTKTELLFIERIIKSLKIGGRAGVIVPDGVLFGSSTAHKRARSMLLNDCELQGIISLPSGIFKPYAGVSTAILIFVKGGTTDNVWFYEMKSDGFTLDDKRVKVSAGGDIPDIIEKWHARDDNTESQRKSNFFYVNKQEIEAENLDLSISRYKLADYEEVVYEEPKAIMDRIRFTEQEILTGLDELDKL